MNRKTVIITGATTGIGKATALTFARAGYNVVITSRNPARGEQTIEEFKATGVEATFMALDVTNEADFAKLIDDVVAKFGKLDVIVNNAGIASGQTGFLADSSGENLKALLDTNVLGLFYGMKYAIIAMLKTGGGSVVNLASITGANGVPYSAQYCATKHAVVGLTKAGAVEYATQGIRINAIAPGAIKTDILKSAIDSGSYSEDSIAAIHPMKRMGTPEDIANGIFYLASDASPFMTGTILFVDGGYNAQ